MVLGQSTSHVFIFQFKKIFSTKTFFRFFILLIFAANKYLVMKKRDFAMWKSEFRRPLRLVKKLQILVCVLHISPLNFMRCFYNFHALYSQNSDSNLLKISKRSSQKLTKFPIKIFSNIFSKILKILLKFYGNLS